MCIGKKFRIVLMFLMLCPLLAAAPELKKVLFISSYHPAFPSFNEQVDGLEEVFKDSPVTLDIEFMDTKRFPVAPNVEFFQQYLTYKLKQLPTYDLILIGDDNALHFALNNQQTLFKDLPIIFFGLNNADFATEQNSNPLVTGVVEATSMKETIALMLKLQPNATRVAAITDTTTSGQSDLRKFYALAKDFPGFEFYALSLQGLSWEELSTTLGTLNETTALILFSAYRDSYNQSLLFYESLQLIMKSVKIPVFHLWSHGIGEGLIGGMITNHKEQAVTGAKMAVKVLQGTPVETLSVITESPNQYMFDYNKLKEFSIPLQAIPEDSILLNEPYSFYYQYKFFIWTFSIILLLLTGFLLSALLNIKKRKKAEIALVKSREHLATTLNSIGEAVIVTDELGIIDQLNPVAEKLIGVTAAKAKGKSFTELVSLFSTSEQEQTIHPVQEILSKKESIQINSHIMLKNIYDKQFQIGFTGSPLLGQAETLMGTVVVIRDLTEQQKLLEHMQRSAKLESIGLLAGGIAHDFNNLLGALFGYIELAKSSLDSPEKIESYLDNAVSAFNRAKDLTNQLLTFSRGGAPIRAVGYLQDVIKKSASFALSGSETSYTLDIEKGLWPCEFDENQISQVLDNLIINASQAMEKSGSIAITAGNYVISPTEGIPVAPGEYIQITITDNGIGIPQEILDKIFDPFFSTKKNGTGLGLSTCHSIIKKHNGSILVHSIPEEQTTFTIYLPRTNDDRIQKKEYLSNTHTGEGFILLMDDEDLVRDSAAKLISTLGYQVTTVANGDEALQVISQQEEAGTSFKAVLLDLTVPGEMGGKEVAKICSERFPHLKLIAASGYSSDETIANPKSAGFIASISKPYLLQDLRELFERLLL